MPLKWQGTPSPPTAGLPHGLPCGRWASGLISPPIPQQEAGRGWALILCLGAQALCVLVCLPLHPPLPHKLQRPLWLRALLGASPGMWYGTCPWTRTLSLGKCNMREITGSHTGQRGVRYSTFTWNRMMALRSSEETNVG